MPATKTLKPKTRQSVEYKKSYDRRKRSEMAARLRYTTSCSVCNVKFTKMDGKRTLCYKASCEYMYSLKQSDTWRVRAEQARLRMVVEHGAVPCVDSADSCLSPADNENAPPNRQAISSETVVLATGVVNPTAPLAVSSTPCPYRSCTATLDSTIIERMKSGEIPQTVCMGVDGGTVGVCTQCKTDTYWCGAHYKDHSLHTYHVHGCGSMYASNDPPGEDLSLMLPPPPMLPSTTAAPDQFLLAIDDMSLDTSAFDDDLNASLGDCLLSW